MIRTITLTAAAAILTSGAVALAEPGQPSAGRAQVSIAHARSIALRTEAGNIVSQGLEREKGGSGLRYSFDIRTAHGVREVGIDARSGAILEDSADATEASDAEPGGK